MKANFSKLQKKPEVYLKIEFFSYNPLMIVNAKFEKYSKPLIKKLNNIQGGVFNDTIPGLIHFNINIHDRLGIFNVIKQKID